jgi:superfamily II DNA/RNA helicase
MADRRPSSAVASPSTPTFADLGVPALLVDQMSAQGITTAFPIQSATLPDSLAGRDVLGRGRTGSGKTYAFLLPLVARLAAAGGRPQARRPRGLILAPTRELVNQIDAALAPLAKAAGLRTLTVYGGVKPGPQVQALGRGVDIVVACPGRLEDHLRSGNVDLSAVAVTVLDEADHMADLGFLPGVKRIMDKTPRNGQRLLFSATLDAGVDVLVRRYLDEPVVHSVDTAQSPVSSMTHHILHVDRNGRLDVITDLAAAPGRTVLFTRTKRGAKVLARQLNQRGVPAVELHGNLSQNARTRALDAFSSGKATTLVATDIAARGIHVDDVGLVVHADPPSEHKAYLHRSGRTARAGASGTVVTVMVDGQQADVRDLTRKAGIKPTTTKVTVGHPLLATIAPGERRVLDPIDTVTESADARPSRGRGQAAAGGGGGRSRRSGAGRGGAGQGQQQRSRGKGSGARTSSGSTGSSSGAPTRKARPGNGSGSRSHSAASFSAGTRSR